MSIYFNELFSATYKQNYINDLVELEWGEGVNNITRANPFTCIKSLFQNVKHLVILTHTSSQRKPASDGFELLSSESPMSTEAY